MYGREREQELEEYVHVIMYVCLSVCLCIDTKQNCKKKNILTHPTVSQAEGPFKSARVIPLPPPALSPPLSTSCALFLDQPHVFLPLLSLCLAQRASKREREKERERERERERD